MTTTWPVFRPLFCFTGMAGLKPVWLRRFHSGGFSTLGLLAASGRDPTTEESPLIIFFRIGSPVKRHQWQTTSRVILPIASQHHHRLNSSLAGFPAKTAPHPVYCEKFYLPPTSISTRRCPTTCGQVIVRGTNIAPRGQCSTEPPLLLILMVLIVNLLSTAL